MSSTPTDLLDLAKELYANPPPIPPSPSDAVWRCVIGRAYYAAFSALRRYFESRGSRFPVKGVHQAVRQAIANASTPHSDAETVSIKIGKLINMREISDYELAGLQTKSNASLAINLSSEIIDLIKQLP